MQNVLLDKDISIKAKGIYFMIKTLNDNNEKFTKKDLYAMTSTGSKSFDSGWKELKDKGYLEIQKENINGIFTYRYLLLK